MSEKLYPPQNPIELGDYFMRHLNAMTVEGLHSKADIAEQLAWRDREIERLRKVLAKRDDAYHRLFEAVEEGDIP